MWDDFLLVSTWIRQLFRQESWTGSLPLFTSLSHSFLGIISTYLYLVIVIAVLTCFIFTSYFFYHFLKYFAKLLLLLIIYSFFCAFCLILQVMSNFTSVQSYFDFFHKEMDKKCLVSLNIRGKVLFICQFSCCS